MRGQSFINFLREEEGKADRRKVLSISALIGSSALAQLMFVGLAHAGCPIDCVTHCPAGCVATSDCPPDFITSTCSPT